jgi:hypothetical protein
MTDLDAAAAISLGGWDERFAVVVAVAARDGVGAAIVDTNGDGADVDLDLYTREPDGAWVGGSSGNDGVGGGSWNHRVVTASGWASPGSTVTVDYLGERHQVTTAATGCWLFVAATAHPEELPRLVDGPHGP